MLDSNQINKYVNLWKITGSSWSVFLNSESHTCMYGKIKQNGVELCMPSYMYIHACSMYYFTLCVHMSGAAYVCERPLLVYVCKQAAYVQC